MSDRLLAVAMGLGILALGLGVASLMWSLEMLADAARARARVLAEARLNAAARGPRSGQARAQAEGEPP